LIHFYKRLSDTKHENVEDKNGRDATTPSNYSTVKSQT